MTIQESYEHHFVFSPNMEYDVWCKSEESAIALVNTYHKMGMTEADRYTRLLFTDTIPF